MDKLVRIKELVELLNKAGRAYYQESTEIMSNFEYDALYDELVKLETETGIILAQSPTVNVGYEILSELPKEVHAAPMLSLDKTKEVSVLKDFLGNNTGYLSWKMDGLTIVLTYKNGMLFKAVTRGNGEVGEVITNNAKTFSNIPLNIAFKGELILRGEAVISYSEFEKINALIDSEEEKYKNPRNLCAGTVRQLNNEITAKRNVMFYAFTFVSMNSDGNGEEQNFDNSKNNRMLWLKSLGFDVVESHKVTSDNIEEEVKWFANQVKVNDFPTDGLVITYDDIAYSKLLGRTSKFPKDSLAFKWADETAQTTLKYIEWSASRTGLINPVAVFEPVELEGTSVSRASVHNVSMVKQLGLGVGDTISVYKANMIIPQISENHTRCGKVEIPDTCPVCGGKTVINNDNGTETLFCPNKECGAKTIMCFTHFVGRDAMNIDGLSQMTLEKFIDKEYIKEFADIFKIDRYENEIIKLDGFGQKSYNKMIDAIEKARNVDMAKFIYALGIANVGLTNAKLLVKEFDYDFDAIRNATLEKLVGIYGLGEVIGRSIRNYFDDINNSRIVDELLEYISFNAKPDQQENNLEGMIFVITGSLEHYSNRNELKSLIESKGGKVASAVSGNTNYLINNDILSNSSKNKKAKELSVEIITEEDFINKFAK